MTRPAARIQTTRRPELAGEEPLLTAVPGIALEGLPVQGGSFPYGVMGGDATDTRVMLWTKYTGGGTLGVQIEPATGAGGMAVASRALTSAEQGDAGFMHVDIAGLTGGSRYRYAFYIVEGPAWRAVRSAMCGPRLRQVRRRS